MPKASEAIASSPVISVKIAQVQVCSWAVAPQVQVCSWALAPPPVC